MSLVVCIGNELVADDAVGFEVHARLEQRLPRGVKLEYCSVGGIALLDLLDGTEECMVVVDAMCLGAAVGTLHCMGFDHERLTYRYQGRDFRLTDIHGKVVESVLS